MAFLGSPGPNESGRIVDIRTANHVYAHSQLFIAMVDLKRLLDVEKEDTD